MVPARIPAPFWRFGSGVATHNLRGIKDAKRMKAFGYVIAKDLGHAVALLGEHGAKAKILAGGTDLLVELKHAVHNPEMIVDVSRLAGLKAIAVRDDGLPSTPAVASTMALTSGNPASCASTNQAASCSCQVGARAPTSSPAAG
jgi:xanthine dehydrogenase iron-sulfur cluster and FAD-binding subunit A